MMDREILEQDRARIGKFPAEGQNPVCWAVFTSNLCRASAQSIPQPTLPFRIEQDYSIAPLRLCRAGIPLEPSLCLRASRKLLSGRSLSSMHVWRNECSPKLLCIRARINVRAREVSTFRTAIPCFFLT